MSDKAKNRCRYYLFFCIGFFFSEIVFALPLSQIMHMPSDVTVNGYVDGSYHYLLRSNQFTSGTNNRVNDLAENGFTLQQAALTIAKEPPQGMGGLVNFVVGRDAYGIAPNGINPDIFGSHEIGFVIPEAYLQFSQSSYTFYGGELLAIAGLEQYNYTNDTNFSRSILDGYAQPGSHMGIRGVHDITDRVSLIVGLANGWSTIQQPTHLNAIEIGVKYFINHQLSLTVDGYTGEQYLSDEVESGPKGRRNLVDIFTTWYVTEKLSLAANYDYGEQSKASLLDGSTGHVFWQGMAGYLNYHWLEKWLTSLRCELFEDTDGYRTGVKQNWREITLTLAYLPLKNLQLRAETRHDFSNVNSFLDKNGISVSNNQQSYALEMLYQF